MKKIAILGAGISGISAGYHLKKDGIDSVIFEKESSWGGLCDNFEIEGFRFDKFIHLSFTQNNYVEALFEESTKYEVHIPDPMNYYKGCWLKHPAQNNLYPLSVKEKLEIIKDFIDREDREIKDIKNYEEWLKVQYGNYFAKKFPMQYTKKYWTLPAKELEIKWIGKRMYKPTIDEILEGAMTTDTPNTYYAKEMRYPLKGGYKSFLNKMADGCNVKLNKEAIEIDIDKKLIKFSDGSLTNYEKLISSIPLPELCKIIKDIPKHILEASGKLKWTSGALISLGFKKPDIAKNLWFYIYDEDIRAARIYSPSLKSKDNVPEDCSSIQAEIYFSNDSPLKENLEELLNSEIKRYIKMGLFREEDVILKDIRIEKYANVIFDHEIYESRKIVRDYLQDVGIECIGRFGEWDYFWSDQSLLSGKEAAKKIRSESLYD